MRKKTIILLVLLLTVIAFVPLAAEEKAAGFSLKDAQGNIVSLEDFKGSWVHLDFSADWCYWCHYQGSYFAEVMNQMEMKDVRFVSIAVLSQDEYGGPPGPDVLTKWTDDYSIEYVLADPYGEITGQYPVEGFPTNVIVSPQGEIMTFWSGAYETAEDFMTALQYDVPEMFE